MIRALIDVSSIPARPDKRTGLARVAIGLSQALARRPDVSISTCAWGSLAASHEFAAVREEFPELHGVQPRANAWERFCVERQRGSATSRGWWASFWHRTSQVTNRLRNPVRGISLDDFDVIHSTYAALPRVVRKSGRPTVLTLHDIMPLVSPHLRFPTEYAGIMRRIVGSIRSDDWIACVSEWTRSDFVSLTGHSPERVAVIHNGVDHSVFQPCGDMKAIATTKARLGIGDGPFVLSLSSLAPHKNLRLLFDAWSRDAALACRGTLVIAGGRTTDLTSLTNALGISARAPNVLVTGHVSDTDFRHLASSCQAFLFPSLYEGFGLPVLEAMACGAPIIASDATSLPEVVGDAGILLPPEDVDAWGAAMKECLDRPVRRDPDSRAVQRAAAFSWDGAADAYVRLYRRAMA